MEQLHTGVMVMIGGHRLVGRIVNAGQRLQEILNNKLSTFLHLYDVELFRASDEQTPPARFAQLTLTKEAIQLLLVQEARHEAPTNRLYSYVQKNKYRTFLTLPGYEVAGQLHFTSLPKPEVVLKDDLSSFLPVSQATVTALQQGTPAWQSAIVFVRRAAIAVFHVGEQC